MNKITRIKMKRNRRRGGGGDGEKRTGTQKNRIGARKGEESKRKLRINNKTLMLEVI